MIRKRAPLWSLGVVCAGGLFACNAPDDLREWRASDHRHTTEATPESAEQSPQVTGSAEPPLPGLDEVTIAAWRRACIGCHGQLGRGDGPQGPMVKARDLSDPVWQASVTDAQIAESITKGRGRMPPAALPEGTVEGLVRLVRLFDRNRMRALEAGHSTAPAAPSVAASAAPPSTEPSAASSVASPSVGAAKKGPTAQ
jgi:cytochrome c oxidase cbb3-type subunit 3